MTAVKAIRVGVFLYRLLISPLARNFPNILAQNGLPPTIQLHFLLKRKLGGLLLLPNMCFDAYQCDQMARLFFNIQCSCTAMKMKMSPMAYKFSKQFQNFPRY